MRALNYSQHLPPCGSEIDLRRPEVKDDKYYVHMIEDANVAMTQAFRNASALPRQVVSLKVRQLTSLIGYTVLLHGSIGPRLLKGYEITYAEEIQLWELAVFIENESRDLRHLGIGQQQVNFFPMFGGLAILTTYFGIVPDFDLDFQPYGKTVAHRGTRFFLTQ